MPVSLTKRLFRCSNGSDSTIRQSGYDGDLLMAARGSISICDSITATRMEWGFTYLGKTEERQSIYDVHRSEI